MTDRNTDQNISWIDRLEDGSESAAAQLWADYFQRLVRVAQQRMPPRGEADAEDVALSAIDSLVRGAQAGKFNGLNDAGNLWRLLVTIAIRKARSRVRSANAARRGGGKIISGDAGQHGMDQFTAGTPSPDQIVMLDEQCEQLLAALNDNTLRQVATLKLQGYSNEEIATQQNCAARTVRRRLNLIREIWLAE